MAFSQALETYRERLKGDYSLKDRSKVYREERIAALLKSWPELAAIDVAQVSKTDCALAGCAVRPKRQPFNVQQYCRHAPFGSGYSC